MNKYPSVPLSSLSLCTHGYMDWNQVYNCQKEITLFYMIGTNSKKVKLISNGFILGTQAEGIHVPLDLYKKHFNKIDVFNKAFYFFRSQHRHYKWTHVWIDDAISIALANSLALYNSSNCVKIKKKLWMKMVAKAIFDTV